MPDDREKYVRRVEETLLGLVLFTIVVYWPLLWVTSEDVDPSLGTFAILAVFVAVLFGPRIYRNYRQSRTTETTTHSSDTRGSTGTGDGAGDDPDEEATGTSWPAETN